MIQVQLNNNTVFRLNGISVTGNAFCNTTLLKEGDLADHFMAVDNESIFKEKLQQLSGHFSVVIESAEHLLCAVDTIRTFPLFIKQTGSGSIISDDIHTDNCHWNEKQISYFKKVYCTLENNTLLKEWKQLQGGEYGIIDKNTHVLKIAAYYRHRSKSKSEHTTRLKELELRLIENIKTYANNRPLLIPLSGGYDSRYLLALLKEHQIQNVSCFTYGRKESYEVLTAKNVCEQLKVQWHFIEYTDTLLQTFFSEKWNAYSDSNHHFTSLPHEQDFFALQYLQQHHLLPENAVIINGFCQDIHAGSFIEPVKNINLAAFIFHKYQIQCNVDHYENSWNGYQEWLVKNRLSKFIINSVHVYEYFGLDFYLPFWQTDWINFWYALPIENRLHQQFYNDHLLNGIFRQYGIDFKKPAYDSTHKFYTLKKIGKTILPGFITKFIQQQNSKDIHKDANNTLFLYDAIYHQLKEKPAEKDFRINNIHALYLVQNLKEKYTTLT